MAFVTIKRAAGRAATPTATTSRLCSGLSTKSTLEDHGEDGRSPARTLCLAFPTATFAASAAPAASTSRSAWRKPPNSGLQSLVAVFREVRRVLRPEGTLWLELGDSYNSATAAARQASDADHGAWQLGSSAGHQRMNVPGLKPKDLIGAPWLWPSRSAQTAGTSAATSSGRDPTPCPNPSPTGPPNPTATCSCSRSGPGISSTKKPSGKRWHASTLADRGRSTSVQRY